MARAFVSAAVKERARAELAEESTWKCGDWMSTTPNTPQAEASQMERDGRTRKSGQESNATQIGKVFVRVITSDVGSRVRAKNVHSKLALLAQPRNHNAPGRQKTSLAPQRWARARERRNASPQRVKATTRQSVVLRSRCVNCPIQAMKKQPPNIHR
jgi:hypothetical protein